MSITEREVEREFWGILGIFVEFWEKENAKLAGRNQDSIGAKGAPKIPCFRRPRCLATVCSMFSSSWLWL
jgi:hypothetical protein